MKIPGDIHRRGRGHPRAALLQLRRSETIDDKLAMAGASGSSPDFLFNNIFIAAWKVLINHRSGVLLSGFPRARRGAPPVRKRDGLGGGRSAQGDLYQRCGALRRLASVVLTAPCTPSERARCSGIFISFRAQYTVVDLDRSRRVHPGTYAMMMVLRKQAGLRAPSADAFRDARPLHERKAMGKVDTLDGRSPVFSSREP